MAFRLDGSRQCTDKACRRFIEGSDPHTLCLVCLELRHALDADIIVDHPHACNTCRTLDPATRQWRLNRLMSLLADELATMGPTPSPPPPSGVPGTAMFRSSPPRARYANAQEDRSPGPPNPPRGSDDNTLPTQPERRGSLRRTTNLLSALGGGGRAVEPGEFVQPRPHSTSDSLDGRPSWHATGPAP